MNIVALIYPGVTPLDLVGPLQIWSTWPNSKTELVAESLDALETDTVMKIVPTHTYETASLEPDILFVPGGTEGNLVAMGNERLLDFVRSRGAKAKWVTSVCTGALILGAAGLLKGYKCTTHWLALEQLAKFGAEPVKERWVIDRNRASGGGVTAGIDFGLAIMAELAGRDLAEAMQLAVEYAPQPPFQSGTPEIARPEVCSFVTETFSEYANALNQIVDG